ncbi:MAG: hydrogenase nickel incorporation protein HypB [Coriobacteriales bacterium]|jgi:hydrogenase nickel incorporation protein HypB
MRGEIGVSAMGTDRVRIVELKKTILEDNDADALALRDELTSRKKFYVNVMSSPGSGKTSVLLSLLAKLEQRGRHCGVMEADIDSDVDARTMLDAGYPAVQLHTGGMCHLDAQMSRQGLVALGTDDLDIVFLENVGNLVCPAEFETGAHCNLVILSVPEGHDKPLKYPLMFQKAHIVAVNKIDALPAFDFDFDKVGENIHMRNPEAQIIPVSARTGEGIDKLADAVDEMASKVLG